MALKKMGVVENYEVFSQFEKYFLRNNLLEN